ncbi:hypothetical protein PQG02_00380 (plasmid) [Nostoc sp. UHCC 0926]|uniref:hypothetical protein n=1 Tax=Nostoc sp. UHCC 0926 TaxID=3025190 RepID=UPI00236275C7|nr:hypothetical protein [Nostoc sp. UHCC 0926]WDD30143.1 hypothetical protein PQG02_00380 [Nostoc sp. UHCC 0926]
MNKPRTKGSKNGKCNICGTHGKLTDDHVPPKGSINPSKVRIITLSQTIKKSPEETIDSKISRFSQNGLKFLSLCSKCNNYLLGTKFDQSLNDLSHKVARILHPSNRLILPKKIDIEIQPQRLARAVIGHLLAAEIRDDMNKPPRTAPMVDAMRHYFLDETLNLPNDLKLYFWPYTERYQAVFRGIAIAITSNGHCIAGDFLKFLPVAFWLTYKAPTEFMDKIKHLEISFSQCNIDTCNTVSLYTKKQDIFRSNWPEVPDDDQILVLNDGMCLITDPI